MYFIIASELIKNISLLELSDNVINPFSHSEFHANSFMHIEISLKTNPKVCPNVAFPRTLLNQE